MDAHPAPQPPPAPPDRCVPFRFSLADRFHRLLHAVRGACQELHAWMQATTLVPAWLPWRLRHPLMGYLLALLIALVAASVSLLLVTLFPAFDLEKGLLMGGIVLVALTCGVGPGVFATGVSLLLLAGVVPPVSDILRRQDPEDWVTLVVLLMSGVSISLLAGSLRAAKASSDLERQRLRTLLEVLPVPIALVDREGRFQENTPAGKPLWGDSRSWPRSLAELPTYPAWRSDTRQAVAREELPLARALTTGETTLNEELEFETVAGQRRILLNSATPIRDASGAIRGAASLLQDITERKRLEREVAEHAAQLDTIFESIADGLIVTDAQRRVVHMNQASRTLLGIEHDPTGFTMPELERLAGFSALTAEGHLLTEVERPINRYLQGEVLTRQHSVDLILRTRARRETFLNISGTPIRAATSHIIGSVQVIRDVTEQRRLEQQTRETLHALLAMAEALVQAPEPGLATLAEGAPETTHVARRLAELTRRVLGCRYVGIASVEPGTGKMAPITLAGVSPEQAQQWWASWEEHGRLGQHLAPGEVAALHAGEPILVTGIQTRFPKGRDFAPGSPSVLVPMRMGDTLVGILRVEGETTEEAYSSPHRQGLISAVARLGTLVLERERLLRERTEAQANELALRETQAQMETFLGMAGHELKNPLTSLKLALQLVERRINRLAQNEPDRAHPLAPLLDQVTRARLQSTRLERLVNELLDVSRVRAGKLELHPEPTDLAAIVGEAVDEQRQAKPARTLILQSPPEHPVLVWADADRIGQVVTNYLTNALKYSPADRPVEVGLNVEEGQARVWVRDEGPGLPPEEQDRIWERFHRVPSIQVQSGTGVGLGLGLHICRTIIERHQGQVGVQSTPGQGSTFWFTLPPGSKPEERGPAPR